MPTRSFNTGESTILVDLRKKADGVSRGPAYLPRVRSTPTPAQAPMQTQEPWSSFNTLQSHSAPDSLVSQPMTRLNSTASRSRTRTGRERDLRRPVPNPSPNFRSEDVSISPISSGSTNSRSRSPVRPGGRRKGSNLPDSAREKANRLRKTGACWRCALSRGMSYTQRS